MTGGKRSPSLPACPCAVLRRRARASRSGSPENPEDPDETSLFCMLFSSCTLPLPPRSDRGRFSLRADEARPDRADRDPCPPCPPCTPCPCTTRSTSSAPLGSATADGSRPTGFLRFLDVIPFLTVRSTGVLDSEKRRFLVSLSSRASLEAGRRRSSLPSNGYRWSPA